MPDLSLVRAALAHGSTSPLPVPNFAYSLLRLADCSPVPVPVPVAVATVTDLPARPDRRSQEELPPPLRQAG